MSRTLPLITLAICMACGSTQRWRLKTFRCRSIRCSPVDGAEEYAIRDHEGFGGYALGEHEGIEAAHEIAVFIEEFPDFGGELINHFGDLESARKSAEDNYAGCHKSLADYAAELTEETTTIPGSLRYYIDYERMARDMELSGDVFTIEEGYEQVHIFWSR
jgi:antirestriction protein